MEVGVERRANVGEEAAAEEEWEGGEEWEESGSAHGGQDTAKWKLGRDSFCDSLGNGA